jgi:hypothetical protein
MPAVAGRAAPVALQQHSLEKLMLETFVLARSATTRFIGALIENEQHSWGAYT